MEAILSTRLQHDYEQEALSLFAAGRREDLVRQSFDACFHNPIDQSFVSNKSVLRKLILSKNEVFLG